MIDPSGKQTLVDAISLSGFENWHPSTDVPGLNRPRTRPESFIGWHSGKPDFVRSEAEVEEIIETSLAHLLNPATLIFGDVEVPDRGPQEVPYYQVGSHRVWGATAIMVRELIERISRVR